MWILVFVYEGAWIIIIDSITFDVFFKHDIATDIVHNFNSRVQFTVACKMLLIINFH